MATTSSFVLATPSFSSSLSAIWDVFLSFYGKDSRKNFIANLYTSLDQAGIVTFRDDPELEKGEKISAGLLKAIHGSKMFVIVLSENYAYSPWCLNELVEILGCKRNTNRVVPVFYHVDPSDLRHQRGSFGEALRHHSKRYSVDIVNTWRFALAEIAELSGYHLKKDADENESDMLQEIVEYVARHASTKALHLEEHLVGIDSSVKEIYKILSMESNDIRAIGICGMGGIGKTTTAKAFYNRYSHNFVISCFLEIEKQHSLGGSHFLFLINQLLIELIRRKDYVVYNVESGIRKLKQILRSKKALIILDNLHQSNYLELLVRLCNLLTTGSRVIITTRDANLLKQLKVDISQVEIYTVKELDEDNSLELFSYHAFRKSEPPESFRELTLSFVAYGGGLPLALKVLGSSLRGRNHVSFWKAKLEKVRKIPDKEIQKILQLSYDELDDETEKAIFLDIAFFFIGKDKDEAVPILDSCDFFPNAGIPVLVERCLLTIDQDNKFKMHDLIQDMGRELGKSKGLFWRVNDTDDLQNLEGAETTEGLILDLTTSTKRKMSAKMFERLPKLRLLELTNVSDIKGHFKNSFHQLRCIRWCYCPWTCLPSTFRPKKLVLLDMPFSRFKTLWSGTMPLVSLKIINVSYSMNLKNTPDFRESKLVEKLLLHGCKRLVKVHPSIGQLIFLGHLDLADCDHLKELPDLIGQLTLLRHLDMGGCVNLQRLPEPINQLTNLGLLDFGRCQNLKRLPEQLGNMKGLKILDASYTAIEQLPESIAHLKKLFDLKLIGCTKLKRLPEQFGNIEGLQKFNASSSALENLPVSFGRLKQLVELKLSYCQNLTSLPNCVWLLGKMQCLDLPDSIGLLSTLNVLNLIHCEKLESGPVDNNVDLLETVKDMQLKCICLRCDIRLWLPVIINFSSLERLTLKDEGQSFSSTKLYSLSKLTKLLYLTLENCTSLGSSFPELPLNLQELEVHNHALLEQLPDLSSLKQLEKLDIQRCISLQSLPPLPPHLEELKVIKCASLQDLPDLSFLKELRTLNISQCSYLKSVCLAQSSLQVGRSFYSSSFKADVPNRTVAEWFSYKSSGCTLSFSIPSILGDDFLGIALWIVYECKSTHICPYIRAVITNAAEGTATNYHIYEPIDSVGEVQSRVECIRGDRFSAKSGDTIKISFQRFLYSDHGSVNVKAGEVKVEMCGVHVIRKNTLHSVN